MPTPEQMHKLFEAVEATARYAIEKEKHFSIEEDEDLKRARIQALTAQLDCTKSWCG
ncbi:MAG: hypothetical protein P8Y72_01900 [Anaerolineales bacterium]|jgi:hypothetical protein